METDLRQALMSRLEANAQEALRAYGEAWAEEIAARVPVDTGALRGSVRWERTGPATGEIVLAVYGKFVDKGHKVARWGTARRPRRPYKTRGFVPGLFFIAAAHVSPRVQAARRQMARILAGKE